VDVVGTIGLVVLGLVALWVVLVAVLWLLRPRGVSTKDLLRVGPDVVRLGRDLVVDPATPRGVRAALVLLVVWLVSPIDLIPEFIPILGLIDDVIVAVVILRYVRRRIGGDELRRRWRGTPESWALVERLLAGRVGS
jgi:uncharacterized membrane protein YkvA (DUF1232 family)